MTMSAMFDELTHDNLRGLHAHEENLRDKSLELVTCEIRLQLHISIIGNAMNLADQFRQFPTDDEDLKSIQALAMRTFNAFGASFKLALSGYGLNSFLILRSILETIFLLDLFNGDRQMIERWRCADEKDRKKDFYPANVRKALDDREGFKEKKRMKHYNLYSEFAAHPTAKSVFLMRTRKDGDAQSMPFIEPESLTETLFEMARLAMMFGDILDQFFLSVWADGHQARAGYKRSRKYWLEVFDPRFR